MRIRSTPQFLVLRAEPSLPRTTVAVVGSLADVVAGWTSGTRVSPVWRLAGFGLDPSLNFAGKRRLLFLGPVSPDRVFRDLDLREAAKDLGAWTTLGTFNVVLNASEAAFPALKRIVEWAQRGQVASELWHLENGVISKWSALPLQRPRDPTLLGKLAAVSKLRFAGGLKIHAEEFLVLMSSALARSALVEQHVRADLAKVANATIKDIRDAQKKPAEILDVTADLIGLNAALSRFSSQAFSGISPIVSTECHFWIHSFLGTGLANLALARLVEFIGVRLGDARLPERLNALKGVKTGVPTYEDLVTDLELLRRDHLGEIDLPEAEQREELLPIVTYFSGRDGYSSQLQTLSAPLTSITQANSFQTNILTVTHEISHVFVEGMLGYLYPDPDDATDILALTDFITSEREPATMFEAARRLLIEAVIAMEQIHQGRTINNRQLKSTDLLDMLTRWRREAKEVMVHTFDFLYFFQDEPQRYIETIWSTWCAIPGISERIPEYVLRTLCAISPQLLDMKPPDRRTAAYEQFVGTLKKLGEDDTLATDYAKKAIAHIEGNWLKPQNGRPEISKRYDAWLYLVRLVFGFMYSPRVAASLFEDHRILTESKKKKGQFDEEPIGNPIQFIRNNLMKSPSEADSLWLLHNVALCLRV